MEQPDRKDFFISYNKADKAWAEWIAWELEAEGYSTVIQAWDFRPGRNFVLEMHKAAKEAQRTIAVLSLDYLTSEFTQPEWAVAFAQDPTGAKGLLVPVRVRKVDIEGLLGQIIYIDLVDLAEEAARKALIDGVEQRRGKPSTAPGFPGAKPKREAPRFPGALPPIWNVPHQRNPNFTGRQQLLVDLHASLTEGKVAALTALHGLGGVGKTQMALEYAYRFASDYDLVWWVRSEDPATLAGEYAALAGPLDLPEKEEVKQEIIVAAVRQCLGQTKKWLLIFDNAAEPNDLKGYLPQGEGGQVLITSRFSAWRGTARPLDVKVWDRPESVAFLLKRTGEEDEATAGELAQELGDLPLALEQAAAYMDACGQSFAAYLKLFREHHQELLNKGQSSQEYKDTVATTWALSFQKVQQESPAAADLLNLCAFLAPDDIPKELLEKGSEHLASVLAQSVQDHLAWNEVCAALRRYSLMDVTDDSLSMHRLVQAVVRDRLDEDGKKQWAGAAVEIVNVSLPQYVDTDVEIWPWYTRLLPHALAAARHADLIQVSLTDAGRVLNQVGLFLRMRAEFDEAKKIYERNLSITEAAYGSNHSNMASSFNNLGLVLQDLGDIEGAKKQFELALTIDEATYGQNHPKVALRLNNLGSTLYYLGDLEGAKGYIERALAIDEVAYGPNHPDVALVVNNLGAVLQDLGDMEGARENYERALRIAEATYGTNHPKVASRLNNLGSVLQALGDLEGARTHYERALAIFRQFFEEDHPYMKGVRNNLASLSSLKK